MSFKLIGGIVSIKMQCLLFYPKVALTSPSHPPHPSHLAQALLRD
jgi:hypothetical protein